MANLSPTGANVHFKTEGLKALNRVMKKLPKELVGKKGGPLKTALFAASLPVFRAAQEKAPVNKDPKAEQPGRLKMSIRRRRHTSPKKLDEIIGVGVFLGSSRGDSSGAFYAGFVEFGTVKQSEQPYMIPALEENVAKAIDAFIRKAKQGVDKIERQLAAQAKAA